MRADQMNKTRTLMFVVPTIPPVTCPAGPADVFARYRRGVIKTDDDHGRLYALNCFRVRGRRLEQRLPRICPGVPVLRSECTNGQPFVGPS